jgi:hypothetical protein
VAGDCDHDRRGFLREVLADDQLVVAAGSGEPRRGTVVDPPEVVARPVRT